MQQDHLQPIRLNYYIIAFYYKSYGNMQIEKERVEREEEKVVLEEQGPLKE